MLNAIQVILDKNRCKIIGLCQVYLNNSDHWSILAGKKVSGLVSMCKHLSYIIVYRRRRG